VWHTFIVYTRPTIPKWNGGKVLLYRPVHVWRTTDVYGDSHVQNNCWKCGVTQWWKVNPPSSVASSLFFFFLQIKSWNIACIMFLFLFFLIIHPVLTFVFVLFIFIYLFVYSFHKMFTLGSHKLFPSCMGHRVPLSRLFCKPFWHLERKYIIVPPKEYMYCRRKYDRALS